MEDLYADINSKNVSTCSELVCELFAFCLLLLLHPCPELRSVFFSSTFLIMKMITYIAENNTTKT